MPETPTERHRVAPRRLSLLAALAMLFMVAAALPGSALADVQVTGTVTRSGGGAVADVAVQATPTAGGAGSATTTGPGGQFALTLAESTYDFTFAPPADSGLGQGRITGRQIDSATTLDVTLLPVLRTFSGTIADRDGAPLSGVQAILGSSFGASNGAGQFSFQVPAGTYGLQMNGSNSQLPRNWNLGPGAQIDLRAADQQRQLTLQNRFVTFRILDAAGNPAPGIAVEVVGHTSFDVAGAPIQGDFSDQRFTDSTGTVRIPGFPTTGPATVHLQGPGITYPARTIQITDDAEVTYTLPALRTLSGTVRDDDGNPLSGMNVILGSAFGTTSGAGTYQVRAIAGAYPLRLNQGNGNDPRLPRNWSANGGPTIDLNEADQQLDITIPTRTVTVHVVNADGSPAANVAAEITGPIRFPLGTSDMSGSYSELRVADATGTVRLPAFPSGSSTVSIRVTPPGQQAKVFTLDPIGASDPEVTYALGERRTYRGVVRDRDGEPLGNVNVVLGGSFDASRADGSFAVPAPAGSYGLQVNSNQSTPGLPRNFQLSGGPAVDLTSADQQRDITLQNRRVTVRAVNADGSPAPNVAVEIVGQTEFAVQGGQLAGGFSDQRFTGTDGIVVIPAFPTHAGQSATVHIQIPGTLSATRSLVIDGDQELFLVLTAEGVETDVTPPEVTGVPARPANANGWYREPVGIDWQATDPPPSAGPASTPAPTLADREGDSVLYTSDPSCDAVGNCARGNLVISLDETAPTLVLNSPAEGSSVPQADYQAPTCEAADALSGLDGVCHVEISEPVAGPGRATYTATATAFDRAGNSTSESRTFTVLLDRDGPQIAATAEREPNLNGWYMEPVRFSFTCADPSGIASCPVPFTFADDGANQSHEVSATDTAGNTSTLTVAGVSVDGTDPVVRFTGAQASYTVDQRVQVTCEATDALSGIDTATCPSLDSPAADLALGATTLAASAADRAGNQAGASVSFTVLVTPGALSNLVDQYLPPGQPGNGGVATALKVKIAAGDYGAFINQVEAQAGKRLTEEEAATLIRLVRGL